MARPGALAAREDSLLRGLKERLGWKRRKKKPKALRQADLIREKGIETVIDVGANKGQFGASLRAGGFAGRIISFEPLSSAFSELNAKCASDPHWECHNLGIGSAESTLALNVSANSHSSSFLQATERTLSLEPSIGYVRSEHVAVRRLDQVLSPDDLKGQVLLKIDTQGFELEVLKGAGDLLKRFALIQTESAWLPSYSGQPTMSDLVAWLNDNGFGVVGVEKGWTDAGGFIQEVDIILGNRTIGR